MIDNSQVWMTIGRAAAVAGVASRTAFRWVEEGRLEVRQQGASRLVEVGALRAFAERSAPPVALASAMAPSSIARADPPSTLDRIVAMEARISVLGDRLREIEIAIGAAQGAAGAAGDRPGEVAP